MAKGTQPNSPSMDPNKTLNVGATGKVVKGAMKTEGTFGTHSSQSQLKGTK